MGVAPEIGADQRLVAVFQYALELVLRRLLEGGVDVGHRHVVSNLRGEVRDGAGGGGNPEGHAVQLAVQFGQHQSHGPGRAGAGGDNVHRRRPRPPQVAVPLVQDGLVVGVRVDGGHQTMLHYELVMQHLHHRREAVGSAGGVGDDGVLVSVVQVVVDAQHQRQVFAPGRRGDDDLLGPARQVSGGLLGVGEDAGGLHNEVNPHLTPRNGRRVAFREYLDGAAVHDQVAVVGFHLAGVAAVAGIPLEQVGVGLGVGKVIDRRNLNCAFVALLVGPEHQPSDSSKPVDSYARYHV